MGLFHPLFLGVVLHYRHQLFTAFFWGNVVLHNVGLNSLFLPLFQSALPFFSNLVLTVGFCYGCDFTHVTECYTVFGFMLFELARRRG